MSRKRDGLLVPDALCDALLAPDRESPSKLARAYGQSTERVLEVADLLGVPYEDRDVVLATKEVRRIVRKLREGDNVANIALETGVDVSEVEQVLEDEVELVHTDLHRCLRPRHPTGQERRVLDHGYVKLVEAWGSDAQIVAAARMSTGRGFRGWGPFFRCAGCGTYWRRNLVERDYVPVDLDELGCDYCDCDNPRFESCSQCKGDGPCRSCCGTGYRCFPGDEKLLEYLYTHQHTSPFEMAGATFEIKLPIFVARQWMRHRTQSYNEMSARYTKVPDEHYLPSVKRLLMVDEKNKQAGTLEAAKRLDEETAEYFRDRVEGMYAQLERLYHEALKAGVPKELARIVMPVGRYTIMRAGANLHNWLRFLRLRLDEHAQWEIRQYASTVRGFLTQCFPRTMGLFSRHS